MSFIEINVPVQISTRVRIKDIITGEVLVDKSNAIHRQNMARVIARGLAHEPNYYFHRLAFGNGGTFRDATGNLIYNPPNDGRDGSWESRLYHETYSEVIDEIDAFFGEDTGSAETGNIRPGGGSVPTDDPLGGGSVSQEVGTKSNVIVKCYLNENEPVSQTETLYGPGVVVSPDERCFQFDELGLYSPGAPATASNGFSSVITGTATSESNSTLVPNTNYTLTYTVDGNTYSTVIHTPAGGTGPQGEITYGDICEGINTGNWITSGDIVKDYLEVYITDRSGGTYPSIIGMQSYGYLIFQSKTVGVGSSVELNCSNTSGNFFGALTSNTCTLVNVNQKEGRNAGVANDPANPANERERLLTHLIFDPIHKSNQRAIEIEYILTISVAQTTDSQTTVDYLVNGSPGT